MRFDTWLDSVYLVGSLWGTLTSPQICRSNVDTPRDLAQKVAGSPLPRARVTAFVNVNVIPMDTERVLPNQTVLVEGGGITALGPTAKVKVPAGAVRVDGRGQYLIPGLADMHVHFMDAGRDSAFIERTLFRFVASGVTTIRNMDYTGSGEPNRDPMLQWRARAAAGQAVSPRIYTSSAWGPADYTNANRYVTGKSGQIVKHETAVRLDSIAVYLAAYQAAGYDFLKPYFEQDQVFDSLLVITRRLGLPMAGHIPGAWTGGDTSITLERVLASGAYASIEHLMGYRAPGRSQSDSAIRAMAAATQRAGVWNAPTLWAYDPVASGVAELRAESLYANVESRLFVHLGGQQRLVKALLDAGAGLLLATDASADRPQMLPGSEQGRPPGVTVSLELAALVRAGLTPYQALRTGTRNAAEYFGTLDSAGTVTVGKRADLVLLPGNPLRDVGHTREPSGVMLGGRWLDREALDRGLLGAAATAPGALLDDWLSATVLSAVPSWVCAQRATLTQLRAGHTAQRKALTDSLAPGSWLHAGAERARVLRLMGEQFGAMRAVLTAGQRAVFFDPPARVWLRAHARQGTPVTIPGVTLAT